MLTINNATEYVNKYNATQNRRILITKNYSNAIREN